MDTSNHDDGYESCTDSEEEEEEKEMMFHVFPTLYCISSRREKIPMNTSILTGAKYIREILDGHPQRCLDILRMESHIFQALCDHLRSKNLLLNSKGVSVEEQLGMFMYMISRNASYRTLTDRFQRSPETVHRHINGCFNAMRSLAFDLIKHSSLDTHRKISTNPQFWPFFENCLGAIDGTHVVLMIIASNEAASYRNRKGTLSQNVMVACDFDLNFVCVSWLGGVCLRCRSIEICHSIGLPCNFGAKEKMVASTSRKNTRHGSDDSMRTTSIIDINDTPALDDVDERENTARDEEEFGSEDADGDHPQVSESSVKGKKPKKQKGATSVQCLEDSMMAYVNFKKEQATKKEKVSQQGKQPSITECLEVLNDMDDVPDEVKIFGSDVFRDAANREIFLGYKSRLRGSWLKKEVDKIIPQPSPSRVSSGGIPSINLVL